jgi:hypothetical protein
MARRRNPYRPGTESYARWRQAQLARRAALAQATAERAKKPEARRRAKRRVAAAKRGLREISARRDYRSALNQRDRDAFSHLSIDQQNQLLRALLEYSEAFPPDLPDPFAGRNRSVLWRLYYATRAGIRQRQAA